MTLLGLPAAQLAALFGAGAAVLTVLYLLKQRRRRLQVPFLNLWAQVLRDATATALQRRLRLWLSLLLQLLCLGLLLLSLGDPRLDQSRRGRNLVLLIDASASMQAPLPGAPAQDRLGLARREAHRVISGLSGDDRAAVMVLSGEPAPLSGFTQDEAALHAQVDAIPARDEPADLPRALRLCADLLADKQGAQVVLFSDGGFDDATLAALDAAAPAGPGVSLRYQPLPGVPGQAPDNLAITAFSVRRYTRNRLSYEVLLEVTWFSATTEGPAREVQVELLQEGEVVDLQRLRLRPGERVQRLYPNLAGSGEHLTARLRQPRPDALPLDDTAYALLPERRRQRVLLVTAGNLFLEGALLSTSASDGGSLQVDKLTPAAYAAAAALPFPYDAVVFDGFTPAAPPPAHALYLDPQGPGSPFPIRETLAAPLVTDTAADHPLLRWVTLADLNVSRASIFQLGRGDVAVAAMLKKPFIAAGQREQGGAVRRVVAVGFDLRRSDLPLRVAFPVLLVNALDWFSGDSAEDTQGYATGRTWRIPTADREARSAAADARAASIELQLPQGRRVPVPVYEGRALYHGHQVGFYELLRPGARPLLLAGNLVDATESAARVRPQLSLGGAALPPPDPAHSAVRRVLWPYLLIAALLLLCLEWASYHRRWTL